MQKLIYLLFIFGNYYSFAQDSTPFLNGEQLEYKVHYGPLVAGRAVLKVTEKEICSGELIKHLDSPVPFMTELSMLKLFVSDIDMMIEIYDHVEDEIKFLKALHGKANMPEKRHD